MARVLVTLRIMPESVDVSLSKVEDEVRELIKSVGGEVVKVEKEPIAFGLVALRFIYRIDESKGGTQELEDKLKEVKGVLSGEIIDVRREFG